MYYTDVFLNGETYFSKGRIWHLGMKWKKSECLFCCVFEKKPDRRRDEVEAVLKIWFEQTLPCALEKGVVEIQRELNRFAAWLKKWNGTEKDSKASVLYLYVQGNIYSSKKNKAVFAECRGCRGVILSWESVPNRKGKNAMENYLTEWLAESKRQSKSPEETANILKSDMLRAMNRGALKQGYFIMWEAEDDFQTW